MSHIQNDNETTNGLQTPYHGPAREWVPTVPPASSPLPFNTDNGRTPYGRRSEAFNPNHPTTPATRRSRQAERQRSISPPEKNTDFASFTAFRRDRSNSLADTTGPQTDRKDNTSPIGPNLVEDEEKTGLIQTLKRGALSLGRSLSPGGRGQRTPPKPSPRSSSPGPHERSPSPRQNNVYLDTSPLQHGASPGSSIPAAQGTPPTYAGEMSPEPRASLPVHMIETPGFGQYSTLIGDSRVPQTPKTVEQVTFTMNGQGDTATSSEDSPDPMYIPETGYYGYPRIPDTGSLQNSPAHGAPMHINISPTQPFYPNTPVGLQASQAMQHRIGSLEQSLLEAQQFAQYSTQERLNSKLNANT